MKNMMVFVAVLVLSLLGAPATAADSASKVDKVSVAANHRYLQTSDGKPFFWLGDTGWLLFEKLDREETERYLENRRARGFNVIQAVVLHGLKDRNAYGMPALVDSNPAKPNVTPGSDPAIAGEYDYWDHVDWVVEKAGEKGIYIAMVVIWGSNVRSGGVNSSNVRTYTRFLAERYRDKTNIFWLAGGDTRGDQQTDVWRAMGQTLREFDPNHLIGFHPFGRTDTSEWFHDAAWLDFNMFQSGHRRYDQDPEPGKGEDNWRYVREDYARNPPKPTIDGEPSYEGIPQGLHDTTQPYWEAKDARRYAWWSVMAGAFGHTYGNNAVIQMYKPGAGKPAFGARKYWYDAIDDPGASQMQHVRDLVLSRPYFERVPDQSLIAGDNGTRYDYVIASRGASYAFVYAYSGRPFEIATGKLTGDTLRAWWFDPRNGSPRTIGTYRNDGKRLKFVPPGAPEPGNDWVLVLDDASKNYPPPGAVAR